MEKRKLRVGVIGVSEIGIGSVYVNTLLHMNNAELVGICDSNEQNLENRVKFFGISPENAYVDYRELIARKDIDAVCIATKDQVHREIAVAALEAGLDVLCEKPMALNEDDCRAMMEALKRTGRKLMIGQICRFTPSFKLAKQLVDNGEIGELFFVESEYAHTYSNESTGWRADPNRHIVIGGGCHAVDLLRWFVGNPIEVSAYGNQKVNDAWSYDDCTIANMRFENNVIGKVMVSGGCRRSYTMRTCLYGSEGTIIVDNTSTTLSLFKEELAGLESYFDFKMHTLEVKIPCDVNNHNVPGELDFFVEKILAGEDIVIDGIQGCNTVIACEAIVKSANEHKKISPVYVE